MKNFSMGRRLSGESGQALAEFGIVIPLVVTLVIAIMELSWISYQRLSFDYGCSHAAWDVTADKLSDMDDLKTVGSRRSYSGVAVNDVIKSAVSDSTLWGFNTSELNIANASATMYNVDGNFSVPGKQAEVVPASTITRYMDINAKLSYNIKPLTFMGSLFFSSSLDVERELNYTRVVGAQHRSQ